MYMKWGLGTTNRIKWWRFLRKPVLCTNRVIHAFVHPIQARVFAYAYGYTTSQWWLAEGEVVVQDNFKVGCRQLTTLAPFTYKELNFQELCKLRTLFGAQDNWKLPGRLPPEAGIFSRCFHEHAIEWEIKVYGGSPEELLNLLNEVREF